MASTTPNSLTYIDDLKSFNLDEADLQCGRYKVKHEIHEGTELTAKNGILESRIWFKSPALKETIIPRIDSIQLFIRSKSQETANSPHLGNWTWFEITIFETDKLDSPIKTSNGAELVWISHMNRFLAPKFGWSEGKVFTRHHNLVMSLKAGNVIGVRLCARFRNWKVVADTGYLAFGIGCESYSRIPISLEPIKGGPDEKSKKSYISVLGKEVSGLLNLLTDSNYYQVDTNATRHDKSELEVLVLSDQEQITIDQIKQQMPDLLIYKITKGDNQDLLKKLQSPENHTQKNLLVVLDADDLWETIPDNPKGLSWALTVERMLDHTNRERHSTLFKSQHILIRLGYEAAIYRKSGRDSALLVYEPQSVEGDFERSLKQGVVDPAGLEAAFIAGLTGSLARESAISIENLCETQAKEAMINGLNWAHRYALIKLAAPLGTLTEHHLKFGAKSDPTLVPVQTDLTQNNWLIFKSLSYDPLTTARDIVKKGWDEVLSYVPTARFGRLVTADRKEIEDFRRIARAVDNYLDNDKKNSPLSLTVFGNPGSGKSFGVKEVIKKVLDSNRKKMKFLEFNLSQYSEKSNLADAFEDIRGASLAGNIPIAFFDEFDSEFKGSLGWLEYFLLPMKEGWYDKNALFAKESPNNSPRQDCVNLQPLGRGIFIFVGGTCATYAEFKEKLHNRQGGNSTATVPTAESVAPKTLSVNLSVLEKYQDLFTYFYEVQNATLSGSTPIVFFNGFDRGLKIDELVWLKYFLAPMQDGTFLDNGHYRPLGRGLFFFLEGEGNNFYADLSPDKGKMVKKPDFLSRMRGLVEDQTSFDSIETVVKEYLMSGSTKPLSIGVSHKSGITKEKIKEKFVPILQEHLNDSTHSCDNGVMGSVRDLFSHLEHVDIMGPNSMGNSKMHLIRRAIILRVQLEQRLRKKPSDRIEVDEEVLNGFLEIPDFRYGARSMEAILAMSKLYGLEKFPKTVLPVGNQLKLHVNAEEFLREVNKTPAKKDGQPVDAWLHSLYCDFRVIGMRFGLKEGEDILRA